MNDPYVECPYVKQHLVPRSRLQMHIIKCQEKFPGLLKVCPFNATHRVKPEELDAHTLKCPARLNIFRDVQRLPKDSDLMKKVVPKKVLVPELDPNHEMWDD